MKANLSGRRSTRAAAALGAILLVSGCTGDPMYAERPANLDGGVGQLLRYCSKFQNSGDLVTAAGLCERAHRLDPADPAPLMQLADILNAMGQPQQAAAAYGTIIETDPGHVEARYALGKLYIALEQYDLAVTQFQMAVARNPDEPRFYNALGVAHGLSGTNDIALQTFEAGLKVAPGSISLRNNFGLSLVLNGRHEEGIKVLEQVVADPKANETSYQNLQLAYGMVSTVDAQPEVTGVETAQSDMASQTETPVMATETPQSVASAQETTIDGTPGEPVTLIQNADREAADTEPGEPALPIEVTVMDSAVDNAGQIADLDAQLDSIPDAETETTPSAQMAATLDADVEETPDWRSPLRMQTARAHSGGLEDSDGPSATMGNYLSAEADFGGISPAAGEPAAADNQVAAVQPSAPTAGILGAEPGYMVQLASYRSEQQAQSGWNELSASAPDLLKSMEYVISIADLGGDAGTFYRLRTAPASKAVAEALCSELRARDIDCLVIQGVSVDTGSQAG